MPQKLIKIDTGEFFTRPRDDGKIPDGFRLPTEQDFLKRQQQEEYEKKPLFSTYVPFLNEDGTRDSKASEIGRTVLNEVGRVFTSTSAALPGTDYSNVDAMGNPIATDPTKKVSAAAAAPELYSPELLAERERHPYATGFGQGAAQLPLAAITGGQSLPVQATAFVARNALAGASSELSDAAAEGRDFDPERALFNGAVGAVIDGAVSTAPVAFRKSKDFIDSGVARARKLGIRDASAEIGPKAPEKLRDFGPEVTEEQSEQIRQNIRTIEASLARENEKIFSEKAVNKKVSLKQLEYQKQKAQELSLELDSTSDRVLQDAYDADLPRFEKDTLNSQKDLVNQYIGELEREVAEKAKVGSGPMELELHRDAADAGPKIMTKQEEIADRVAAFRARQNKGVAPARDNFEEVLKRKAKEEAEAAYGPPIPEEKKAFGELESEKPFEEMTDFEKVLSGNAPIPKDEYKLPHGAVQTGLDDLGNPIYDLADDPTENQFLNALREAVSTKKGDVVQIARKKIKELSKNFPQLGEKYLTRLDDIAQKVDSGAEGAVIKKAQSTKRNLLNWTLKLDNAINSGKSGSMWTNLRNVRNEIDKFIDLTTDSHPEVAARLNPLVDKIDEFIGNPDIWGKVGKEYKDNFMAFKDIAKNNDLSRPKDIFDWMDPAQFAERDPLSQYPEAIIKRGYASSDPAIRKLAAKLEFNMDNIKSQITGGFFGQNPLRGVKEYLRNNYQAGQLLEELPYVRHLPRGIKKAITGDAQASLRKLAPSVFASPEAIAAVGKSTHPDVSAEILGPALGTIFGIPGFAAGVGLNTQIGRDALLFGAGKALTFVSKVADNTIGSAARALSNPYFKNATSNFLYNQMITDIRDKTGYNAIGIGDFIGDFGDLSSAYNMRKSSLEKLALDPMLVVNELAQSWGDLNEMAPDLYNASVQKTYEALNFVRSKIPETVGQSLIRKDGIPPSQSQMRSFALYYSSATNPSTVIEDLRLGNGTPEQMEGLRTVWPETYEKLKVEVITALGESSEPPTLNQRQRLDILFDFGDKLDGVLSNSLALRAELARQDMQKRAPRRGSGKSAESAIALPEGQEMMKNPQSVYG